MQSDLKIKRGLFKNTINVDGEDYKVNEGYFKPALLGFSFAGGASILGNILSKNKIGFSKSLGTGAFGAVAGMGVTEAKKRQIENIFNKDPNTAKSLAKKGFSIKSRVLDLTPKFEWMSDIVRDQNSQLGSELLKMSSLSELNMIRKLDTTEDDANLAHLALEGSGALAILADTSVPNFKEITTHVDAPLVIPVKQDNFTSGTRHLSLNQFKEKLPNTWKVSPRKEEISNHGAIVISPSDANKHSILRESLKSINRSKLMSALSEVPDNKVVKLVNKANTAYSFMASGDDHVADASSGVQFAMHAPRSFEDISATIRAGKLDKKSIIKNTIFASTRALPMFLPIIGRAIRKNQDS